MKRCFALGPRLSLKGLAVATLIAASVSPSIAITADDCTDLCGGGTSPCTIGAPWDIAPGSAINCSGRDVTVGTNGHLTVTDGSFTLVAHDLTLSGSGSTLTAIEGPRNAPGAVHVELTGNFLLEGKIRASGNHGGGRISVDVAGNMSMPNSGTDGLEAMATSDYADGGDITVDVGGTFSIYDPVMVDSGASGNNAGGSIHIRAGGDIVTGTNGHIGASGHAGGGGTIEIVSSYGDITLTEYVRAEGLGTGADGGTIEMVAGDKLTISDDLSVMGGVNVNGGAANGGSVDLLSGCGGLDINAPIDATGGQLGGSDLDAGSIEIETRGNLTLASGITIDNRALQAGGRGGPIRIVARDLITLNSASKIDSRGSTTGSGQGGDITLQSCRINVSSATIDTSGATGGSVAIYATKDTPTNGQGAEPLSVGTASVIHAAGATAAANGSIELSPLFYQPGQCSNSSTTECTLDTDCTIGCQTGDCLYANPDTGGVNTQFDVLPSRLGDSSVGACQLTCEDPS